MILSHRANQLPNTRALETSRAPQDGSSSIKLPHIPNIRPESINLAGEFDSEIPVSGETGPT